MGHGETDQEPEEKDKEAIRKWRAAEVETMRSMTVYDYVPASEAYGNPNAVVIDTTWVDDTAKEKSRLCAREFNSNEAMDDLFSPTPPLIASKMLISRLASQGVRRRGEGKKAMVLDVKRAFLYGMARRSIYVRLPPEDPRGQERGILGKLLRSMYGTRDAPQIWQGEVKAAMTSLGFTACIGHPCVYYHRELDLHAVTHVDDFLVIGHPEGLDTVFNGLRSRYELKNEDSGACSGGREDCDVSRPTNWLDR